MIYKFNERLTNAIFSKRLNKFLVEVSIDGKVDYAHLHDPGRLKKILKKGRNLLLVEREGKRKTKYDVISAYINEWIFIHSGYHSFFAEKILKEKLIEELQEYEIEKREYKYEKSRIDFLLSNEKKCLLEVKGCTLVRERVALFPDAPTSRGYKHIVELIDAGKKGYDTAILFLIMRKADYFSPNYETDKKFSDALKTAFQKNAKILACRLEFNGESVYYNGRVPVVI